MKAQFFKCVCPIILAAIFFPGIKTAIAQTENNSITPFENWISNEDRKVFEILANPEFYSNSGIAQAHNFASASHARSLRILESKMELRQEYEAQYKAITAEKKRLEAKLQKTGAPSGEVTKLLATLENQRVQIEIELAGLRTRRDHILKNIEDAKSGLENLERKDPILNQLKLISDNIERERDYLKKLIASNAVSSSEIAKVDSKIAESRIRLEQRREQLRQQLSGESNSSSDLIEVGLRVAENTSMLSVINKNIQTLRIAQKIVDEHNNDDFERMPELKKRMATLDFEIAETKQKIKDTDRIRKSLDKILKQRESESADKDKQKEIE